MATDFFTHTCDASAAVRIEGTDLFVAASDEDSLLRTYKLTSAGAPHPITDVSKFLEPDPEDDTESDLEGAAQIDDRIYWIGSHGRNSKGKEKRSRQRLFATRILRPAGGVELKPLGKPYKNLLTNLTTAAGLASLDLAAAAQKKPEEEGGFNIEGLAPTPEGHLILGFRNPVRKGRAVLVRLRNPAGLIDGTTAEADLTLAASLDLGGRGIRALEFVPALGIYLVLAGAFDNSGNFALFRWSGDAASAAEHIAVNFDDLRPEELVLVETSGRRVTLRFLSDDGTDECKDSPTEARRFRSILRELEL